LTTHSPSTVALAPEEAIYSMNPLGPRMQKISRSEAVSLLTAGVPTISISFDGRRQVFVESRTDAYLYDVLYQKFKSRIKTERSLVFIPVGHSDASGGEQNAGCAQVFRLVETLVDSGNQTVYGLVDWDGERNVKGRVHVLSQHVRDGLESLIFDPAVVVALVIRENRSLAVERGILYDHENYFSLLAWEQSRWQMAVGVLQSLLFPEAGPDRIIVNYSSGMSLSVYREYLHCDDHALQERIVRNFGFLKPKDKRAGGLMCYAIETVLMDIPGLLPVDLLETFEALLGAKEQDTADSAAELQAMGIQQNALQEAETQHGDAE